LLEIEQEEETSTQLISYIAHAAPATRRPATCREPYLRPEIGFTPHWFHEALGIDFGEKWHINPVYRADSIVAMAGEIAARFGSRCEIGVMQSSDNPVDLLTGTFGALLVPELYGVASWYQEADWPWSEHGPHYSDEMVDALEPPDLDENVFWNDFMEQLDWIEKQTGQIAGFMNWQGVVNTSYRLRGESLFTDMIVAPDRVELLFDCISQTMIEGIQRLYSRQEESGVKLTHITISNCMVNMLSPKHYQKFVLPYDLRMAEAFTMIGVHNCAWNANPYLDHYAEIPKVAYIDMGIESNLVKAKALFPKARRAIMYTPMDIANKDYDDLATDLKYIAQNYGPCDLVCADIDTGTPDKRVHEIYELCEKLSEEYSTH